MGTASVAFTSLLSINFPKANFKGMCGGNSAHAPKSDLRRRPIHVALAGSFPPPTAAIRMGVTGRVPTWVACGDPLETVRPSRLPTRGCRHLARDPQPWPWPSHRRSPAAISPFLAPRLVEIRINWLYMSLLSGCRTIGHQCLPEKVTCINRAQLRES